MPRERSLLVAILGPTASGKSHLALGLAVRIGGEIVNCDSMQMVRFMEIGTAKPSAEERAVVPHHLFDIVDPDQYFSAGAYMEEGRRACREVAGRGKVPVVVGGTGLYFRALVSGIFGGPGRSAELRDRLQRIADHRGVPVLHRVLARRDPAAAAAIQPNDLVRIVRALEVIAQTGQAMSDVQKEVVPLEGFKVVRIGLNVPRPDLYDRINRRVEQMFRLGLIDEVRGLLERGYPPSAKGFEALGYRQALQVIRGDLGIEEAVRLTQRDTRRYAKRQLTWFRREEGVHWLDGPSDDPEVLQAALELVGEAQ